MKTLLAALLSLLFISVNTYGASPTHHLDPEMTGAEYRTLFENLDLDPVRGEFDEILDAGKRNLDWLEHLNAHRPGGDKLELSTPATQKGYPISEPSIYSPKIIHEAVSEITSAIPAPMSEVIFEGKSFTNTPGISDESYLEWARKIDRAYQTASRWLLIKPYLGYYKSASYRDIRGFYFLQREADLHQKLTHWNDQSAEKSEELANWLIGLCHNSSKSIKSCTKEFVKRLASDGDAAPLAYYQKYLPAGRKRYQAFFDIQNPRNDANWSSARPERFFFPFELPETDEVKSWLKDNIEDEFSWMTGGSEWKLELQFQTSGWDIAHVIFVPGATPNVNGLGGSRITMDANRSIHEYSSRWTIRHEFGHVLGIPDCYTEFYDENLEAMVNYQIDIENLMCSRRGKFQQLHYDEMKRVYFKSF